MDAIRCLITLGVIPYGVLLVRRLGEPGRLIAIAALLGVMGGMVSRA